MKIYPGNTTDFNNNGLGFLTDAISCIIDDEINGNYSLTLEYIKDGQLAEYLVEENIIKSKVADGTEQLFRIKIVQKNFKTIIVTAQHIFYDLLNNFLEDVYPQNLNGTSFLNHILNNTNFSTNFTGNSNISDTKSARYVRKNPVIAIIGDIDNSMINLFGGELKRDNFTIDFLTRVGNNNGVKLLFGKNITGIDINIDITNIATRVMPQGFDGLILPEKYVDSALINNYPTPKIVKLEFDDIKYDPDSTEDGVYTNINDAYNALRAKVQEQYDAGLDKPQININVDWIELSKTNEYKDYINLEKVNIGDTITANILDMDYETRVIATKYDALEERIVNFQIGTFKPSLVSSINKMTLEVKEIIPSSILEQAQANATNLITSAMGGYVYKTQSELFIMDTNDPTTATKVWRWNLNGLAYSSNGINGPYTLAMTMDGKIVADFITTGTLSADRVSGGTLSGIQLSIGNNLSADTNGNLRCTNANISGTISSSNATITGGSLQLTSTTSNPKCDILSTTSGTYTRIFGGAIRLMYGNAGKILMGSSTGSGVITVYNSSGNNNSNISGDSITTPKITAGNIASGQCTLNSSSTVSVSFGKTFPNTPRVVITPNTSASGVISPKIRNVSTTGFTAIIGGSGFSNIDCDWIAISN